MHKIFPIFGIIHLILVKKYFLENVGKIHMGTLKSPDQELPSLFNWALEPEFLAYGLGSENF